MVTIVMEYERAFRAIGMPSFLPLFIRKECFPKLMEVRIQVGALHDLHYPYFQDFP